MTPLVKVRCPSVLIVMGVSGSGKTTVGTLLARLLQWEFADGDAFHSAWNAGKMSTGVPLTDEDRWPWLHAIAAWIDAKREAGERGVLACSALKRSYRRILVDGRDDVRLVYLKSEPALLRERLRARHGHFMPAALLQSQLDTLEEPGVEENAIIVSVEPEPHAVAREVLQALGIEPPENPAGR
jgi:carbohydrate kinase (thermoresistant glucokinase family)